MCKISVIVPIYNGERFLPRTFKCLQNQTFDDFEVILLDDGSIDRTEQLCKNIVKKDSRFKYRYQENEGVSAARNNAMNMASGEYIAFIDADDEIPNNYLEELLSTLLMNQCEVAICDVAIIRETKEVGRFSCKDNKIVKEDAINLLLSRKSINSGPCAKLFARKVLNGITFPMIKAYEDVLFVLEVFDKCDDIASTCKTEYKYYQNEYSTMSNFNKMPSLDIIVATEAIMEYLVEKEELDGLCVYVTLSHLMQYVQSALNINDESVKDFIKNTKRVFRKYSNSILSCSAFPWKEKIIFIMFVFGINYANGKFSIVR